MANDKRQTSWSEATIPAEQRKRRGTQHPVIQRLDTLA